ncbi:MAG: hypothetical protein M1812_003770 [Candelaria pacifica]|nr:MAG: hypothetical protein M1812_003770 [Candelaria pacifica]
MPSAAPLEDAMGEDVSQMQNALAEIQEASVTPAKQRKSKLADPIRVLCEYAFKEGLPAESLNKIIDIITTRNHLNQASITSIVKNLYPAAKVSSDAIVLVIGGLGQGMTKPSLPTQASLLKWLIMVYEVLEDSEVLSKLYGVMFNMLDMISLRASLCHLLSLVTRRKHVKPFRIQALLELSHNVADEPALRGLIRVYKEFYPDIIVGEATAGRASYFRHPDSEWREKLHVIQEAHAQRIAKQSQREEFKVSRRGRSSVKRNRSSLPEVHTSRANEASFTLEEVESVEDFVERLEQIELPNQLISALDDPLLQKYLALRPSEKATKRLEKWLSAAFDDISRAIIDGNEDEKVLSELLRGVLTYTRRTKNLPKAAVEFLLDCLPTWNGTANRQVLLELLTYMHLRPFEDQQASFLGYVEAAILDNTPESKSVILEFYTAILRMWTVRILSGQYESIPEGRESPSETLSRLFNRTDLLCLSLLETGTPSFYAMSSVLSFYEAIAFAITYSSSNPNIRITTPTPQIIYLLTFTNSVSILSRLCSVLTVYKRAFESAMNAATSLPTERGYPREHVNHFNGFLMDICNCLWRNRAFNREDANALGCLIPTTVLPSLRTYADGLGHTLPTMFSLSHSTTLCALSIACFRDLEDAAYAADPESIVTRHAGPVTQRSLTVLANEGGLRISWANYRLEVLKWLDERGVGGIGELMFNTMKHLMNAKVPTVAGAE